MLSVIFIPILAIVSIKFIIWFYGYIKLIYALRNLPKHRARHVPFLGHVLALMGNPQVVTKNARGMFREDILSKGHGLTTIWIGTLPVVIVVSPNAAGTIFR